MAASAPPRPRALQAGPAPHWRSAVSRRTLEVALILGLTPTIVASIAAFGWAAVGRLGLAAGSAVLIEWLAQKVMRQRVNVGDLSALSQGLLLALLLPPTAPQWLVVMGVFFMIVVAKQLFGGAGGYPFNPVLIGWAVLLLSWGHRVHPVGDALLGTAWTPAVAIGGGVLLLLGHIDWEIPLGMIAGVFLTTVVFVATGAEIASWDHQLLSGSVLLGAFFIATDRTCSPSHRWARLLFGLIAGALVLVLRRWGIWPEPVPFALLLANAVSPLLDRIRPAARQRLVRHA